MTKSIITILLTFYSAARVSAIAYHLYYGLERLPMGVLLITCACCLVSFGTGVAHYKGRLRGKTLKSVLMLIAVGALANMLIIYLNPVNHLENMDLLITGSFFDVVFYLGALTLRIPDAAPPSKRKQNCRNPKSNPPGGQLLSGGYCYFLLPLLPPGRLPAAKLPG